MGLSIYCEDETAPIPRETVLELVCDAEADSLFPPARAIFRHQDGIIAQRTAATKAGWLESSDGRGRIFLCPVCAWQKRINDGRRSE
jgi:hypothetical protein